jgi:hypothetical protein
MLLIVRLWILLCAFLVGAGWCLSAIHQLNRAGYLMALTLAVAVAWIWPRPASWSRVGLAPQIGKLWRRCRRPAPFLFVLLAVMTLISGILYVPYNSDSYSYRLPRIYHWLAAQQWHWIHTADQRMNVAGCGYEWLAAPVILFTHSTRFLFLINWCSFLLLPGLAFALLREVGVRPRTAWWWMWLLGSGWCYVAQAASIANDGFATVYSLAAGVLALKSLKSGSLGDLWLSFLAAALVTGTKQSNIPLVALWLIPAAPQIWAALKRPLSYAVLGLGTLISIVPITIFNVLHTGTWSGINAIAAGFAHWRLELDSPIWGVVGNVFCLPVQNLVPPFFPWASAWNNLMDRFVQTPFGAHFRSFEAFGHLSPGVSEASAGIGLGVTLLAMISLYYFFKAGGFKATVKIFSVPGALQLAPWLLLVVFMAKNGEQQNGRHLAPYYMFLLLILLSHAGQAVLVRKAWWQKLALLCMASSAVLLVIDCYRPLFPACTLIDRLAAAHPESHSIGLLKKAYGFPRSWAGFTHQLQSKLPAGESVLGYAGVHNSETESALWEPFGTRRVERVTDEDSPRKLREHGIRCVVIQDAPSPWSPGMESWMERYHATLIADVPLQVETASPQPSHVYVLQLGDPP